MKCTAKILPDSEDPDLSMCTKCGTMQCTSAEREEIVAHVIVDTGGAMLSLRAFGKIVQDIAQMPVGAVTKSLLLKAKRFTMLHKEDIQAVVRRVEV